jgi:hypothetical protein
LAGRLLSPSVNVAEMPKKKRSETKTAIVQLRIRPSLKKAIAKAASDDRCSMIALIEKQMTGHLKKRGYLPKK